MEETVDDRAKETPGKVALRGENAVGGMDVQVAHMRSSTPYRLSGLQDFGLITLHA